MAKRFGLTSECIEDIKSVFGLHPEIDEAIMFGSRAMGNYKKGSDIDIALKGSKVNFNVVGTVKAQLDELPYAYTYDIVNYYKISNKSVVSHIDELGISFYKKDVKPGKWELCKLEEFAELRKEQIAPNGKEQPYIGLEHIEQQNLRLNGIGSSNDVISNKFKFYRGDILYGKLRPYFRKVYKPNFDGVCSTDIYVIKNREKADPDFLFYLIATEEFTKVANSGSSGTRMPRADWKQIEDSEWNLPDITTQREIASILSSLDNKIELTLQMNRTLETMSHTIFKEWFVTTAEENWKTVMLKQFIEIKGGLSYEAKHIGTGNSLLLGMGCVSFTERFLLSGARLYSGESNESYLAKPEDIVIATRQQSDNLPILGFPARVPYTLEGKKIIVGANLYKVFNKSILSNAILFQLLRSEQYKKHILANSKGSTVRMITKDSIELFEFKLPPKAIIEKCTTIIQTLDDKIDSNYCQIEHLTQIRDGLMSKLVTGKIQIKS
jgi:type I restriction enzyme S subunit